MTLAPASLMLWGGSTGVRLIVWCRDRRHRGEPDPASAALRRRDDITKLARAAGLLRMPGRTRAQHGCCTAVAAIHPGAYYCLLYHWRDLAQPPLPATASSPARPVRPE